ncbi:CaiB/BaiF CoA transferase family protein [Acuticoccus yangtzensis]|uniref:CaiB/BaiF CoA transferase family protein n=1 Tax=Acuticoccus yangtzensis TaxID=1443441 RepID=UPI0009495184|nr:CoA transferase [Acuticoccus yangtzensis]ORE92184.1 CAIB/BAIF family protein [Stappia sp. 22II-S9-Z10]
MGIHSLPFEPDAPCPLDGVKVLDFSRLVAGNMLSLQLADFGAEVVKVEVPGTGDTLRHWRNNGVDLHWKVYGRNKKSITLNLKAEGARAMILKLLPHFDVMLESFRFGFLEKIGLGPDVLLEANPNLVLVRVSGFGQTGPYRTRPGFGTLVEAMSGFAANNGFEDREPVLPPLAMADMIAGLYGAMATVIAVRNVEQNGGKGQVIDLSLLESIVSTLGPEAAVHTVTGRVRKRVGSGSESSSPRNVYATKDGGWVAISASTQRMTERLFEAIGRPELVNEPRFATNADRVEHRGEVDAIVGGFIAEMTLEDAISFFEAKGVTAAPVYNVGQFLEDPHVQERGIVVNLPDEDLGAVPVHAITPRLSGTPGRYRRPAPRIGEHNEEIWPRAGFSVDEVRDMAARGTI